MGCTTLPQLTFLFCLEALEVRFVKFWVEDDIFHKTVEMVESQTRSFIEPIHEKKDRFVEKGSKGEII